MSGCTQYLRANMVLAPAARSDGSHQQAPSQDGRAGSAGILWRCGEASSAAALQVLGTV